MKSTFALLLFIIVSVNAQSQSNSPNFKQIFDFQVGDIFMYEATTYNSQGNGMTEYSSYTKYEITKKTVKGDSLIYERKIDDRTLERIVYEDSASHFLNRKNHDIVSLINYNEPVFLRVRTVTDLVPQKVIGGRGYNFIYNNGICDTTKVVFDQFLELTYGRGLGLISETHTWFEIGSGYELIGYRKGNDTIGIILSSIPEVIKDDAFQVFPNPFTDKLIVSTSSTSDNYVVDIFTQQGNLVKHLVQFGNKFELSTSDLDSGIYMIRITSNDKVICRKTIKQ